MISITPGEAFGKHMNCAHPRADLLLVRDVYHKTGEAIDRLEDMGVEFLRRMNHKEEVFGERYDPIPGLYAAGLDACNMYRDGYSFILPTNAIGLAPNSGRIA